MLSCFCISHCRVCINTMSCCNVWRPNSDVLNFTNCSTDSMTDYMTASKICCTCVMLSAVLGSGSLQSVRTWSDATRQVAVFQTNIRYDSITKTEFSSVNKPEVNAWAWGGNSIQTSVNPPDLLLYLTQKQLRKSLSKQICFRPGLKLWDCVWGGCDKVCVLMLPAQLFKYTGTNYPKLVLLYGHVYSSLVHGAYWETESLVCCDMTDPLLKFIQSK